MKTLILLNTVTRIFPYNGSGGEKVTRSDAVVLLVCILLHQNSAYEVILTNADLRRSRAS